jgi:hypothetical protein
VSADIIPFPQRPQPSDNPDSIPTRDSTVRALNHHQGRLSLDEVRAIVAPARAAIEQARRHHPDEL